MKRILLVVSVGTLCFGALNGCHSAPGTVSGAGLAKTGTRLFQVKKDNKWGYINKDGDLVIANQFDLAYNFSEGLAAVCFGPCKFVKDNPKDDPKYVYPIQQTFRGLHGFINTQGTMIINPRFTWLGEFHHGLASAATDAFRLYNSDHPLKFGYIDKSGTFAIPEQFKTANPFDDYGMAAVCVGSGDQTRCGYIDTKGTFVINPQFFSVGNFENDLAWVVEKEGMTQSYINRSGQVVWKGYLESKEENN